MRCELVIPAAPFSQRWPYFATFRLALSLYLRTPRSFLSSTSNFLEALLTLCLRKHPVHWWFTSALCAEIE